MGIASKDDFFKFIEVAIRGRVRVVMEEEIEEAKKRVGERVHSEMDAMALNVLAHYEVQTGNDCIVIRVQKDIANERNER